MVLRQSIVGGPKAAFLSSIGNCAGILIWSVSSAIGLSAIFTESETAYLILKWSGVVFLTFISAQTFLSLRKEFGKFDLESHEESTAWGSFRLGLITNLTNAKAAVYAVAFIPAFIPKQTSLGFGIIALGAVWALAAVAAIAARAMHATLRARDVDRGVFLMVDSVWSFMAFVSRASLSDALLIAHDGDAECFVVD